MKKRIFVPALFSLFLFSGLDNPVTLTLYKFPELRFFPKMPQPETNPVTEEGAELGRYLFYDPVLSYDSSMSCASCHKQIHAFSDSPKAFSTGRNEPTRRNTMPLFNLAWYPAFFWDGKAGSIEDLVFHPVRSENELNLDWKSASERLEKNKFYKSKFRQVFGSSVIDSIKISYAIAQFLRTLISHQSKFDRVLGGRDYFTPDEFEGFILINDQTKGDCLHCHITDAHALGTAAFFSNNGLERASSPDDFKDIGRGAVTKQTSDYGKFKIPSLRNLAFTAPYMHDGRFNTLEEVLDFYSGSLHPSPTIDSKMQYLHQGGAKLNHDEKRKIIAFLLTLSDSAFILNPAFSNPFPSGSENRE